MTQYFLNLHILKKITILDFGGQYAHLIGTRLRKLGTFSEIKDSEIPAKKIKNSNGIILSGGPQSVYEPGSPTIDPKILELGIPVLGICYGHQLMNYKLGGEVKPGKVKEYGKAKFDKVKSSPLFKNINFPITVWMSHGDEVSKHAEGFEIIGSSDDCERVAIADENRKMYGVQFHPEVTHSQQGNQFLANFLEICEAKNSWNLENYLENTIQEIQLKVGNKNVFMLVSGGVDSTVAFALLKKALGKDKVFGLFVDTGLMRYEERVEVENALKKIGFDNLHIEERGKDFIVALAGKTDPEEKRKIIGDMFLKVQAEVSEFLELNPDDWLLGQGTIYPDTIETGGTKNADKIKTHHNRVEAIQKLIEEGRVIEPLQDLYKDEVREIGEMLGLPHEIIWRHPFPGPGLGVRILCSDKSEKISPKLQETEKEINNFLNSKF